MPQVFAKEVDHIDEICRDFIAASPFCLIASSNPQGYIDISPKGDPAGFVRVIEEKLIAIPDRVGNRRTDTFHNLLKDPRIGLIFLIPGKGETLRVRGTARIVQDQALRESMAMNEKVPQLALFIHVERAFLHCPKCVIRSGLWQPDKWQNSDAIPDIGHAMIKQANLDTTFDELYDVFEKDGGLDLY